MESIVNDFKNTLKDLHGQAVVDECGALELGGSVAFYNSDCLLLLLEGEDITASVLAKVSVKTVIVYHIECTIGSLYLIEDVATEELFALILIGSP